MSAFSFNIEEALLWTRLLLAFALFWQSVEMLFFKRLQFWGTLQGMGSLGLLFVSNGLLCLGLVGVHFCVKKKLGGNLNGGSDAMTFVALISLSVALMGGSRWAPIALLYLAVQSFLSYLLAGVAKLRNSTWRSGEALHDYRCESAYDVPSFVRQWKIHPGAEKFLAWALMGFELGALLWFAPGTIFQLWLILAAAFHLMNFLVLGLNRFVWIWLATYPALIFWNQLWSSKELIIR